MDETDSAGNSGEMRQSRIAWSVVVIADSGAGLITSAGSGVTLDPTISHNVVAFGLRYGRREENIAEPGIGGIESLEPGQRFGGGTLILSGNTWPADPGAKHTATFTLTTGQDKVLTIMLGEWQTFIDSRRPQEPVLFASRFSLTWNDELTPEDP